MPLNTVRRSLIDALDDLSEAQLRHFCFTVWNRNEKPKVKRIALENKGCPEIVDALVSVYTESRAVDVALETLEEIGRNDLRERLEKDISEASQTFVTKKARNEASQTYDTIHGDIMKVETSGASMETAQQDGLTYSGVEASHAMAETDLVEMNNYKSVIKNAARQKRVDAALIAAIISRSCRAGKTLDEGKGCYDQERGDYNTFGLMQLDVNPNGGGHKPKGSWDSEEHLCQGTDILIYFMTRIKHKFRAWNKEQQLKGGIAAYYAGDGNINSYEDVDKQDYSNDVVARAQWYKSNGGF